MGPCQAAALDTGPLTAAAWPFVSPPARAPGVPELPAPRLGEVEKYNVAARCEEEQRRETETYEWGDTVHTTLAPAADERHCELREYYGSKHPRCLAQLNSFLAADLRLLMGGPVSGSSGPAASGSGGGGSSSDSSGSGDAEEHAADDDLNRR